MKTIGVFLISILLAANSTFGCTVTGRTFSTFDDDEYVFIGTVVGHTEPVLLDQKKANKTIEPISQTYFDPTSKTPPIGSGLIVKVKEKVFLPKEATEFEVFPIGLMADCSIAGSHVSELRYEYPINSEVRIIAKEALLVSGTTSSRIRLEDRPSESGQIVLNSDKTSTKLTTSGSEFDYKGYVLDINKSYSFNSLPNFELRKDLLRLKQASSQNQRNSVLNRIFHAPENIDADFRGIFDNYSSSKAEAKRYFENRFKARDPEGYDLYLRYEKIVSDLMKLGYERLDVEHAIQTAFSEGSYLESKGFLEKCRQVLARRKTKSPK